MTIDELKKQFSGEVVLPTDAAYLQLQNALFAKGAPAVVFQPKNNNDVARAIKYARENSKQLSIRSGGHSGAGFSTNDGGAVIDLSLMNGIDVIDPKNRIVRIGGGAKWLAVAKELEKHHLALSSGDTKTVGVGGLTLGAGVGWMVRKYGLAIDSLVTAEVVTADGKVVRASESEHSDLLWALRGGGGNFGVVTAFEFAAHQIGKVYAGNITYSLDNLPELIAGWRDGMRAAPEDLTTMLLVMPSFMGMPPSAIVMCCFAGDDKAAADQALKPFRKLGKVLNDDVKEKHYYEVLEDAHPPEGMKIVTKNGFVGDFSDPLVKTIADMFVNPEAGPVLQIRSLGGAMNRIAADATAFAHRGSEALIVSPVFLQPDATTADELQALENWRKIKPFTKGGYIGFFTERDEDIAVMYPPTTYRRLAAVKKTYDPHNIFNQNYNVKPGVT
jgi:FAD/FMN-containing dehydrogenase